MARTPGAATDAATTASAAAASSSPSIRREPRQARGEADALRGLVALQREMPSGKAIELEIGEGTPQGRLAKRGAEVLRIAGEALTNARRHSGARDPRCERWLFPSDLDLGPGQGLRCEQRVDD
jgi:signal transduction histidine kinase